jgi:hypothetical protein
MQYALWSSEVINSMLYTINAEALAGRHKYNRFGQHMFAVHHFSVSNIAQLASETLTYICLMHSNAALWDGLKLQKYDLKDFDLYCLLVVYGAVTLVNHAQTLNV